MDTETIKERLNLHVKRRLQSSETTSESGRDAVRPKIAVPTAVSVKPTPTKAKVVPLVNSAKTAKSPKKGRMTKKAMSSSSESINSAVSSTSATTTASTSSNIPKATPLTPTSTTTSAICRTPTTPQPANNNNEGEHDITPDRTIEKHPDILTMVLNEKKLQLMQDPAVLDFLRNIIGLYTASKMSK